MKNKNKVHVSGRHGNISKGKTGKSIHVCLKWVLLVSQYLGLMPVIGVSNSNPNSLRFSVISWRFLSCILYCFFGTFTTMFYLYLLIRDGVDINQTTGFLFHFNTSIITLIFLKLATEWPKIMKKWISVEYSMRNYGYPQHLQRRINVMTLIVLSLALSKMFAYNQQDCNNHNF
nr:gustatory receptor 15 [Podabrus annulatus]